MAPSNHEKMIAAAVWLSQHGAKIGWGDAKDGKAVKRRWKDDLQTDPALVPGILHGRRNSIIVPTGRLVIIDIDKYGWYERLVDEAGLPDTFWVRSPTIRRVDTGEPVGDSGFKEVFQGRHLYVTAPDQYDVLTIPGVWKGGETRRSDAGEQSMVLGPWAMRVDGIYEVLDGVPRVIAEAPASVFDFIRANLARKPGPERESKGDDGDWVWDGASMGSRHDYLRDRVRFWRGTGITGQLLRDVVVAHIEKHRIPLDRPGGESIDAAEIERMCAGAERKYEEDDPEPTVGPITINVGAGGYRRESKDSDEEAEGSTGTSDGTSSDEERTETEYVIDPLAIESRIERPAPMDFHALPLPVGLAAMLAHLNQLTDAPDSSLVLASMVTMSALVGPSPSLNWRGRHRCALFGCLVGHSGVGRKGATMREVEQMFLQVDPLLKEIEVSGLASGEVLVDILNESKTTTLGTSLIWEHEIGNVLILASREGNIMSGNLRRAWDGDVVQSRSRAKGKTSATGYNVAFLGGCTPGELAKRLTADEVGNGWANRFLWFWSEKRPGKYDPMRDPTLDVVTRQYIEQCIEFGRALGGPSMLIKPTYTMRLSSEAQERMDVLAERLDVPPVGAIGALRQRMPQHVIRLAMVAAILDQTSEVGVDHLVVGEAMAQYAVDSMRAVFGVRIDDPLAMHITRVLVQAPGHWMNTTDLRRAIGGKDYTRLQSALSILMDEGFVVRDDRASGAGKGGRPSVGYRLLGV